MKIKLLISILVTGLLLCGMPLQAQSKTALDEAFVSFDRMMSIIKVSSLISKPIQAQGTIIVPFSKISFGVGAGGMMMGFGGGMGGKTVPLGILIIKGEDVRVELFPFEEKKPSFFQEMLPVLFKMLPQILSKKFPVSAQPPTSIQKSSPKSKIPEGEASLDVVEKLFEQKKYEQALAMVDALLAKEPNNAEYHAWKGNIMGSMAQGSPAEMMKYGMGAMQEYEKALQLDPKNAMAHFGRGVSRLMAPPGFGGDVDGAIEDLELACAKKPFSEAYYYLGVAYQKKGLIDKAKVAFKKALELKPDYKEAAQALAGIK